MSRKIFNKDNINESKIIDSLSNKSLLYTNSISACGCLFYRFFQNKLQLLLISYSDPNWPKLDDFGGRIDEEDLTINDAIMRETSEETNNVISKKYMLKMLSENQESFYNKQSKYYVVLKKVDCDFHPDCSVFGDLEIHDNIQRKIDWIDYDVAKPKLSLRLLCNLELIKKLDTLQKNH